MSEETKNVFTTESNSSPNKVNFELNIPSEAPYIVCQVCGHANKSTNGLCEMCSNYLFTTKKQEV